MTEIPTDVLIQSSDTPVRPLPEHFVCVQVHCIIFLELNMADDINLLRQSILLT
jgi:hypothetical protein